MKTKRRTFWYWVIAIVITLSAATYQRLTGPTYPKRLKVQANGTEYSLRLVRSLSMDERSEVRLKISDPTVKAKIYFRKYPTNEPYESGQFVYATKPVQSFLMKKVFNVTEEKGLYAQIPQQPAAGKIQYYIEITDKNGTTTYFKDKPIVVRYKGAVPAYVLIPHIFAMFFAMFLSNQAGAMAIRKHPRFRFHGRFAFFCLIIGGLLLGPLVQKYAFGELWTGIPFGWDLTDNKTLIGFTFWLIAFWQNRKEERPFWVVLAALVLLAIYSIPHSMFGSELNYETGKVISGFITNLF